MGADRGSCLAAHALAVIVLLVLTLTVGESFGHPVCAAQARHRLCCDSNRQRPLRAHEKATENGVAPVLTKHLAPPVLSVPVFSLATVNEDGSTNMNIVTYASPVGIKPEPLWMISLYKSTLSYENFVREGWGVLQLLRRKHAPLVPILGQSGGRDTDKASRSAGEAFPWDQHRSSSRGLTVPQSIALVSDCTSYMTLHMMSKQVTMTLSSAALGASQGLMKISRLPRVLNRKLWKRDIFARRASFRLRQTSDGGYN